MRYKEQVLIKIERLENMLRNIQNQINKNETREAVLVALELVKERLEELRSQINIEQDDYLTK